MTKHETISKSGIDTPDLSVILAFDGDGEGLTALVERYRAVLAGRDESFEILVYYDDSHQGMRREIAQFAANSEVQTIAPRPWGGEDEAVMDGIRRATGQVVVTLPGWPEIAPEDIGALIDAVAEADMAVGHRNQRPSHAQKPRAALAHGLVRLLFQQRLNDIFCRSRAGRREMFRKVAGLGVRQHFLPVVAIAEGYRVTEVPVQPADDAVTPTLHRLKPWSQISALIDLLTLYVALKFLRRPLRFFGAIGVPMIVIGFLGTAWLTISRLAFGTALADRPALVFSVMLLVLGIQIVALGLIGEIIIFASSRRMRSYEIEKILRGRPPE